MKLAEIEDLTIAQGDDWSGIYIDGHLVYEGHSIHPMFLADVIEDFHIKYVDLDWLEERGHLPSDLDEVQCESAEI